MNTAHVKKSKTPLVTNSSKNTSNINVRITRSKRSLVIVVLLGLASAGLYFLLFLFADVMVDISKAARNGKVLYAFLPLLIALGFSLIHGAFTGRFWDLLGLKAKK